MAAMRFALVSADHGRRARRGDEHESGGTSNASNGDQVIPSSRLWFLGLGVAEQIRHQVEHLFFLENVDDSGRHVRLVRSAGA